MTQGMVRDSSILNQSTALPIEVHVYKSARGLVTEPAGGHPW